MKNLLKKVLIAQQEKPTQGDFVQLVKKFKYARNII